MLENLRVALVHEWILDVGGSERVFERLAALMPAADLFALTLEPSSSINLGSQVETTVLQKARFLRERRHFTLPLMPAAWRMLGKRDYDVVLTSSHAFSRFFPGDAALHFSYVHAPLRYAWDPGIDGRGNGWHLAPARALLRSIDKLSTRRVTHFAANSRETAQRIETYYGRRARVINPPVDLSRFSPSAVSRSDFLLGFSRWIPYKRLDLVIEVGAELGMPVVIAGSGPDEGRLREVARKTGADVEFVRKPSNEQLVQLYRTARALVFPAIEDFGIVPLEAQACGAPVAAIGIGGSLDTVVDGVTGALATSQDVSSLTNATERALSLRNVDIAGPAHAASFGPEVFDHKVKRWIEGGLRRETDSDY